MKHAPQILYFQKATWYRVSKIAGADNGFLVTLCALIRNSPDLMHLLTASQLSIVPRDWGLILDIRIDSKKINSGKCCPWRHNWRDRHKSKRMETHLPGMVVRQVSVPNGLSDSALVVCNRNIFHPIQLNIINFWNRALCHKLFLGSMLSQCLIPWWNPQGVFPIAVIRQTRGFLNGSLEAYEVRSVFEKSNAGSECCCPVSLQWKNTLIVVEADKIKKYCCQDVPRSRHVPLRRLQIIRSFFTTYPNYQLSDPCRCQNSGTGTFFQCVNSLLLHCTRGFVTAAW